MHSCTFKEQQSETERDELPEEQTSLESASPASSRLLIGFDRAACLVELCSDGWLATGVREQTVGCVPDISGERGEPALG